MGTSSSLWQCLLNIVTILLNDCALDFDQKLNSSYLVWSSCWSQMQLIFSNVRYINLITQNWNNFLGVFHPKTTISPPTQMVRQYWGLLMIIELASWYWVCKVGKLANKTWITCLFINSYFVAGFFPLWKCFHNCLAFLVQPLVAMQCRRGWGSSPPGELKETKKNEGYSCPAITVEFVQLSHFCPDRINVSCIFNWIRRTNHQNIFLYFWGTTLFLIHVSAFKQVNLF